ncbi:MAG: TetR/AcrR family transcriptional regulator [Myxococcales bacterium]|jgi:AcrR family transcriptional regulator|nr:TetR/AcrR family transcriptional regulator [Myxococcales bacterium]MBL0193176.1 TetR/AcrR family transcriptional regulator [Myxococcales bacterium]HQY61010.1 helix-turn-helix domain-containing protein [Polyangiaceae bacterium]
MARPSSITDAALLEAARDVFVARGVTATTAEIAARAGVSEGTLFKRFGTKRRLFELALSAEIDIAGLVAKVALGARDKPVEQVLRELSVAMLTKFERVVPFVVMHMAGAMSQECEPFFGPGVPPPIRAIGAVEALFTALVEDGRLRAGPTDTMARMFVGALWHYVFVGYVMRRFVGTEVHPMTSSEFASAHATLFLHGVAPEPGVVGAMAGPGGASEAGHATKAGKAAFGGRRTAR